MIEDMQEAYRIIGKHIYTARFSESRAYANEILSLLDAIDKEESNND